MTEAMDAATVQSSYLAAETRSHSERDWPAGTVAWNYNRRRRLQILISVQFNISRQMAAL